MKHLYFLTHKAFHGVRTIAQVEDEGVLLLAAPDYVVYQKNHMSGGLRLFLEHSLEK